jgi:23S rRNA (cytidine1920-2'-O)/16S rRNA (cytidine1409-2'-O)-methyltransferase
VSTRRRLDAELVRRELVATRSQARELIDRHRVQVNGAFADKAARLVSSADAVEVVGERPRFVGRGGEKLAGALDAFGVDPSGRRCVDVGASTGGFTDCLLQAGAASVVAIDVGYGQLHESLVASPAVENRERTNIREVVPADLGGPVDLLVGDLSFISLRTVMGALVGLVREGGDLVLLVKPQFEAGRREASKGRGVIRDREVWRRVLEEVLDSATEHGAGPAGATVSPIRGGDGNVEFLVHLVVGATAVGIDLDELVGRPDS